MEEDEREACETRSVRDLSGDGWVVLVGGGTMFGVVLRVHWEQGCLLMIEFG